MAYELEGRSERRTATDRRSGRERRQSERRVTHVPAAHERRSGKERRSSERRSNGDRRRSA
jgi:hypothetical protein